MLEAKGEIFDPFDNDYIEFRAIDWDTKVNNEIDPNYAVVTESEDLELEICSEENMRRLVTPYLKPFFPIGICFKHRDKVFSRGRNYIEEFKV